MLIDQAEGIEYAESITPEQREHEGVGTRFQAIYLRNNCFPFGLLESGEGVVFGRADGEIDFHEVTIVPTDRSRVKSAVDVDTSGHRLIVDVLVAEDTLEDPTPRKDELIAVGSTRDGHAIEATGCKLIETHVTGTVVDDLATERQEQHDLSPVGYGAIKLNGNIRYANRHRLDGERGRIRQRS